MTMFLLKNAIPNYHPSHNNANPVAVIHMDVVDLTAFSLAGVKII
ncbi:hypothetical protein [Pelosinus propionicus]|nr:hypothetical protein [Pelosinus propionicus]